MKADVEVYGDSSEMAMHLRHIAEEIEKGYLKGGDGERYYFDVNEE